MKHTKPSTNSPATTTRTLDRDALAHATGGGRTATPSTSRPDAEVDPGGR